MSEYSVEQVDEDAMTEFIQSKGCRRVVLGRHMDEAGVESSCSQTDRVFCDRCKMKSGGGLGVSVRVGVEVEEEETAVVEGMEDMLNGSQMIHNRLRAVEGLHEKMMEVMGELQGGCIYCQFIREGDVGDQGAHGYKDCTSAEESGCGYGKYKGWREGVDLGTYQHCWKCGLSQKVCRRLEDDGWCEYPEVMLPGLYILHRNGHLQGIAEAVGFQGDFEVDVWEWMKEIGEGFGAVWESNWMGTWRMACEMYDVMKKEGLE
jgi:hypothetical protein